MLYLVTLSLLIAAVLVIRAVFRKAVSPRLIYALWIAVVIRLCLPISLFEADFLTALVGREDPASVETDMCTAEAAGTDQSITENAAPGTVMAETVSVMPGDRISAVTAEEIEEGRQDEVPEDGTQNDFKEELSRMAGIVWICGAAVMFLWFTAAGCVFRYRLRRDRKLCGKIGRIRIYVSSSVGMSCLSGLIPEIHLTPEADKNSSRELVVLHELTHLRHLDPLWSAIRMAALCVHWFNPLVWAAAILSKQDAELACDDAICSKLDDQKRREYARVLIDTIPQKVLYATGLGSSPMKQRILRLAKRQKNSVCCACISLILSVSATVCSFAGVSAASVSDAEDRTGAPAMLPAQLSDDEIPAAEPEAPMTVSQKIPAEPDPGYLKIPEIPLASVDALPFPANAARFGSPSVSSRPSLYFFDDGLDFCFQTISSASMEYLTGTLTLPDGCSDGRVVNTAESLSPDGTVIHHILVDTDRQGEKQYLSYVFYGTTPPDAVLLIGNPETRDDPVVAGSDDYLVYCHEYGRDLSFLLGGGDVVVPDDLKMPLKQEVWAFAQSPVTSVTFGENVRDIPTLLSVPQTVEKLDVSDGNKNFVSADGVVYTAGMEKLVSFPPARTGEYRIPDGVAAVGEEAFRTAALTEVYVPDSVRSLGARAFGEALQLISLPAGISGPFSESSLPLEWTEVVVSDGHLTGGWVVRQALTVEYRGTREQWEQDGLHIRYEGMLNPVLAGNSGES